MFGATAAPNIPSSGGTVRLRYPTVTIQVTTDSAISAGVTAPMSIHRYSDGTLAGFVPAPHACRLCSPQRLNQAMEGQAEARSSA
jgi:hypothetical protein